MAYDKGRLNAKQVEAATTPGHVADGKGLYLQVSKWGTKSWVFKFTLGGRTRGMGLGPIDELSLKKAREEVERLRVMVREGRDPIEERAEQRRKLKAKYEDDGGKVMLFKDAIAKAHARKEGEFSNEKHRKDWRSSLDIYAVPKLGNMDVAHITHQDVLRVLNQPVDDAGSTLWETKTDTAILWASDSPRYCQRFHMFAARPECRKSGTNCTRPYGRFVVSLGASAMPTRASLIRCFAVRSPTPSATITSVTSSFSKGRNATVTPSGKDSFNSFEMRFGRDCTLASCLTIASNRSNSRPFVGALALCFTISSCAKTSPLSGPFAFAALCSALAK